MEKQDLINIFLEEMKKNSVYIDFETTRHIHCKNKVQLNYKTILCSRPKKIGKGKDLFKFELTDSEWDDLVKRANNLQKIYVPINIAKWEAFERQRKELGITDKLLDYMANGNSIETPVCNGEYYVTIDWSWNHYKICKKLMVLIKDKVLDLDAFGKLDISKLKFKKSFDYLALIQ